VLLVGAVAAPVEEEAMTDFDDFEGDFVELELTVAFIGGNELLLKFISGVNGDCCC
jgi:hypothetical protein